MCILRNSCHTLQHISFVGEDQEEYTAELQNVRITLQCGLKFGMLRVDMKCDCCHGVSSRSYFFTLKSNDRIIERMQPEVAEPGEMELFLPSGDRGTFQLESYEEGFSDSYVLRNLVSSEYQPGFGWFYEDAQASIKLRSAFTMIKKSAYRKRMGSCRDATLRCLTRLDIHEVGIRARIVKYARLW